MNPSATPPRRGAPRPYRGGAVRAPPRSLHRPRPGVLRHHLAVLTGDGGETLSQYGKSKDHRSDCKQMVLGMVIDGDGIPVCSEMWPGNTTDVTTLDRVAERLQRRFGVHRAVWVADAGMISNKQIAAVEARGWLYILGARLRRTKEVRDVVLSDTGPFETVDVERQRPDPMTLPVKEVTVHDTPGKGAAKAPRKPRRYVVCRNPDQARKDAATREQILAALESKLRNDGPKSVVANKGYKRTSRPRKAPSRSTSTGTRRGTIRRHVGATNQHRAERRRGGITLQATVDGRAGLPHRQEPARHLAPSSTRPMPPLAACLLFVPGAGAARRALIVAWTTLA